MITLVFPVHAYLGQSLIYELGHFMDRRFVLMVYLSNLSFWFFSFPYLRTFTFSFKGSTLWLLFSIFLGLGTL